jgi:hypothetical protein
MKNLIPLTNSERQKIFRDTLALKNGERFSVTLSREASDALQVIQKSLKEQKKPHSKRAAVEAALVEMAKW